MEEYLKTVLGVTQVVLPQNLSAPEGNESLVTKILPKWFLLILSSGEGEHLNQSSMNSNSTTGRFLSSGEQELMKRIIAALQVSKDEVEVHTWNHKELSSMGFSSLVTRISEAGSKLLVFADSQIELPREIEKLGKYWGRVESLEQMLKTPNSKKAAWATMKALMQG